MKENIFFNDPRKKAENKYSSWNKEEKKKPKEEGITRRHFLKNLATAVETAAVLGGGFAAGKALDKLSRGEKILEFRERNAPEPEKDKEKPIEEPVEEKEIVIEKEQIFEPEEVELEEEDLDVMRKIFRPSIHEELKINSEVIGIITKYWIFQYQNKKKSELEKAYGEMQNLKPLLKECFQRYGVPEEFMYLAIPESSWRMDAVSKSGAVGPYQFMPDTAKRYGLKNSKDPLESADACARLLSDLHKKSQDWDLALAGYNGGFFWDYIRECNSKNKKPEYGDFLSMLEKKINKKRKDILQRKYFYYTIKRGDSLYDLADRYSSSEKEIKKINHLEKPLKTKAGKKKKELKSKPIVLAVGQKLLIPFNEKNRQTKFEEEASGFIENTNYPPKFNAVLECLGIKIAKYFSGRDSIKDKNV